MLANPLVVAAAGAGISAGIVHALTGPDHLAAIAPLTIERRGDAWRVGLSWGLGHSGGVWLLSLLVFGLRGAFPTALLSHWGERLVGVVLVAIGLWSYRRALRSQIHVHRHSHDGVCHAHLHLHLHRPGEASSPLHEAAEAHRHPHAPLWIGLLHGVAGGHHFLAALPVLALPSRLAAGGYIGGFGLGAILGMALFSWILGRWVIFPAAGTSGSFRAARLATGSFAIGIGVFWLWVGGI
ncbi:MAG: nickel transporter [Methylacidiphilaceae bacterium]|nr:nickel transporter [Candidatus Methylacidiphilaceae bacterium]